ncbi:MAG TPA: hypothetical protein VKE41_06705 [Roseiflexaceae bacterium]|nr:hypothetical protein [Roseiflexaceae bacterium]
MPSVSNTTIAGQLNIARLAISNTLADAELQALVVVYGYTVDKMQAGKRLYDLAVAAVNAQAAAAGTQRQATAQARVAERAARASYQALAQVARALFVRNQAHRAALGLVGSAPQGTAAFLAAATMLFDNARDLAEIKAVLAGYGYDDARLEGERATIAAFDRANQTQVAAIGAAQQATRDRQAALDVLNEWLAQYLKIARIALRDKPQLIEKLGVLKRSSRTPAQRQAPQKAAATRAARKAA